MNARTWNPEIVEIGDQIVGLSVARAAELVQYLEQVHGVKAHALPVLPPVPDPDQKLKPPTPVPTAFDVMIDGFDTPRKVAVIKVVREKTALGLKEAKDLVEAAPKIVKDKLPQADAEKLKAELEAAGAKVSIKPVVE
jgi:large subunit ribosomal protein L7/L12